MINMPLSSCDYEPATVYTPEISVNMQQLGNNPQSHLPNFYQALRGIIIPPEWKSITTKDGKKLSRGALELYSIIVSWHNYKKIKDKDTGKTVLVSKFEGDELKKNYDYFTKELDRSQEQVRRYFAELKAANLVSMELRTVWHKNWKYPHTLCIKLNKTAPHFTKGQGADDYKTSNDKSFAISAARTPGIVSALSNLELCVKNLDGLSDNTIAVKKIWASSHKKVGVTPQKNGVYIKNNNSKTNKIRSDLVKSNFLKANRNLSINFKPSANQQNSFYQISRIQTSFSELFQKSLQVRDQAVDQLNHPNLFNSPNNHDTIGQWSNGNNFEEAVISLASTSASVTKNPNLNSIFSANHQNHLEDDNKLRLKSAYSNHRIISNYSKDRKPISAFHPLTEEDAIYLRKTSGRPFNLRYINMLLLNLASKKPDHGFYTKELLLAYMTPVLMGEKRDAYLVNNETFNFKLNSDSIEYKTNQKKKYLNAIELSRETNILTKIKRRIIGLFDEDDAYNIITSCHLPYITDNYNPTQYTIEAPEFITETATLKARLAQAIKDILGQSVEVIFKEPVKVKPTGMVLGLGRGAVVIGQGGAKDYNKGIDSEQTTTSSSPLWQKIRELLKTRYGDAVDKSWFSKCDIEQSPGTKLIRIKCPSSFIRDWIKQNYLDSIEKVISDIGKTAKDLLPDIDMNNRGYKWLECSI